MKESLECNQLSSLHSEVGIRAARRRPERTKAPMQQIGEGSLHHMVIGLQVARLEPVQQLEWLRRVRSERAMELDPAATDYLDRQIEALVEFTK